MPRVPVKAHPGTFSYLLRPLLLLLLALGGSTFGAAGAGTKVGGALYVLDGAGAGVPCWGVTGLTGLGAEDWTGAGAGATLDVVTGAAFALERKPFFSVNFFLSFFLPAVE